MKKLLLMIKPEKGEPKEDFIKRAVEIFRKNKQIKKGRHEDNNHTEGFIKRN